MKQPLTQEEAVKLFDYNPITGVVVRRVATERGDIYPHSSGHGYFRFGLKVAGVWKSIYAHQIAWLILTGKWEMVDHENGDGEDNRESNLRPANKSKNGHNRGEAVNNKSGQKGVYFQSGKWVAEIWIEGKYHYLGRYTLFEEAQNAYRESSRELCGEFSIYG